MFLEIPGWAPGPGRPIWLNAAMIRFGEVEVDGATREVRVGGDVRHLQPQALDVLLLLAANRDRVVPKEEILDTVWGDQFVSESALTTRIKEIRQAVGDDGRRQRVVKNVRGTGYRFVAEVDEDDEDDEDDEESAPAAGPAPRLHLKPSTVERAPGEPIAYATVGSGPPLVFMPGWISSLDAFADGSDPRAALIGRLADDFAVTVFDRYGTGLSAATDPDTSLGRSADEVVAVLEAIGGGPAILFASSAAGPAAVLAAERSPQVASLVLLCTYASGPALFTDAEANAHLVELVEQSWGMGSRILADMIVPGIDALTRSSFARFQRRTATAEVAAAYIRELYEADVSAALSSVEQPSLVIHYRDDPAIPLAGGRQLAMGIDRTELVILDGPYHTPPAQDVEEIAALVRQFVAAT